MCGYFSFPAASNQTMKLFISSDQNQIRNVPGFCVYLESVFSFFWWRADAARARRPLLLVEAALKARIGFLRGGSGAELLLYDT